MTVFSEPTSFSNPDSDWKSPEKIEQISINSKDLLLLVVRLQFAYVHIFNFIFLKTINLFY